MKPNQLILRCYGKRECDVWVAVCIDLCLAAQGDTAKEARYKLLQQIKEYMQDALAGRDQDHAYYLLTRKAPFSQILTYYYIKCVCHFRAFRDGASTAFSEIMPMQPKIS